MLTTRHKAALLSSGGYLIVSSAVLHSLEVGFVITMAKGVLVYVESNVGGVCDVLNLHVKHWNGSKQ